MRVAEAAHGLCHVPGLQQSADARGRDGRAVQLDDVDAVKADAALRAEGRELLRIACAAVAEAKIVAADEVHGVVAPEQRFLREALPRLRHGLAVEMQREHLVDAVIFPHEGGAVLRRVQQRHAVAGDERVRMCVEGQRCRRNAEAVRRFARAPQQAAVADVDAVKKAERQYTGSCHMHPLKSQKSSSRSPCARPGPRRGREIRRFRHTGDSGRG